MTRGKETRTQSGCRTTPTGMLLCRTNMLVATPWELAEAMPLKVAACQSVHGGYPRDLRAWRTLGSSEVASIAC